MRPNRFRWKRRARLKGDRSRRVFEVFEVYEKQGRIGLWHDPERPGEMHVIFLDLDKVELL